MADPNEINYGSFESRPVRFTHYEAWVLGFDNAWHEEPAPGVMHDAHLLSEGEFRAAFGELPPLPKSAFQSGDI